MLLEIATPIILVIGIIGNLISFIVFNTKKLKSSPTFKFLAHLSIIDFLYLSIGLPHIMMIIYTKIDFRNSNNLLCSLHSFLTIFLSHLSSNTLAVANVVRCNDIISLNAKNVPHATHYKTNSNNCWFKIGRVEIILLILILVLFVFDSHFLFFMRLTDSSEINYYQTNSTSDLLMESNNIYLTCFPSKAEHEIYFEFFTRIWPWIDLFLYSYIPFIVMISSTIVIITKLCQANNNFKKTRESSFKLNNQEIEMTELNTGISHFEHGQDSIRSKHFRQTRIVKEETKRRNQRNLQVYKLLISLNIAFFVMVTPLVLSNSLKRPEIENYALFDLVYILAYLNHCLNFIFYLITCELYRSAIKSYFLKTFIKMI